MPHDLRVVLANRPGSLAGILDALAGAGVNVGASCGDWRPGDRWGYGHVLVEDAQAALDALANAGIEIEGVTVHVVDLVPMDGDRPGALAEVVRRYAEAGRNIEVFYTADKESVVIGTEDMQAPRLGVQVKDVKY